MVRKQLPQEMMEPRPRLVVGKTYIETLLLTLLTNMLISGMKYEQVALSLSDLLLEEIEVISLRMPEIRDLFKEYVTRTFRNYFGEKIPLPTFKEGDIKQQLITHMRDHVDKIIPDFSEHEQSYIDERLNIIASRIILVASKAIFRDLGYIK